MLSRARTALAAEAERLGWTWRPAILVAWAALVLCVLRYHQTAPWFWDLVARTGGAALIPWLQFTWLGPELVLEVGGSMLVLVLLREDLGAIGFRLGDWRFGLKACAVCYALYAPAFVVFSRSAGFKAYYGPLLATIPTWRSFLLWEAPSVFFFMVMTEFFFRGFLVLGLRRHLGARAALLSSLLPFVAWHFDKPEMEAIGSFPVGLALGYLALRTGSIWYGLFLHGSIALLLSATVIVGR